MRRIALAGVLLAFVVVVLGAYVRLTAAGLGCPDWPGCYGHLTPSGALRDAAQGALGAAPPPRRSPRCSPPGARTRCSWSIRSATS